MKSFPKSERRSCFERRLGNISARAFILLAAVTAAAVVIPSTVLADLISIQTAGRITEIYGETMDGGDNSDALDAVLPFTVGSEFTATVAYDLSIHDAWDTDPEVGFYDYTPSDISFTWNIDGTVLEAPWSLQVRVFNKTGGWPNDALIIAGSERLPLGWTQSDPLFDQINFLLRDTTSTVFDTDALPTTLNLAEFNASYLQLISFSGQHATLSTPLGSVTGEDFRITGWIDSLSTTRIPTAVPEPSTLLLLGTGLLGLAGIARKRKSFTSKM